MRTEKQIQERIKQNLKSWGKTNNAVFKIVAYELEWVLEEKQEVKK